MHDFTPSSALLGGGLIGLAASLLLIANGRTAGISGMLADLLTPRRSERLSGALFLLGLLAAGAAAALIAPERIGSAPHSLLRTLGAGLLVGSGARLANGCTSGHGVCGVSRLSARSLVATSAFIAAGMCSALLGGGS